MSGLNDAVWDPNFWLPTAWSLLRAVSYGNRGVNVDLGDYFINLPLPECLEEVSGVDLTPFRKEILSDPDCAPLLQELEKRGNLLNQIGAYWGQFWMVLCPSPEWSAKFYYLAKEFIRDNEREETNPLYWDNVVLKMVGTAEFNPG